MNLEDITAETPIGAVIDGWLDGRVARRQIKANTAYNHRSHLLDFARYVGPDKPIGEITGLNIEAWLAQPRRNGDHYGAYSINARSAPIRALLRWASNLQIIPTNPAIGIQRARPPKRYPRSLSEDEVKLLLWGAGARDRSIILVGLHLGLRRQELHDMNVEHWDRRDSTLRVVGKGDKERFVPVEHEAREVLELWTDVGLRGRRFGPMWPSRNENQRLSYNQIGGAITSVAEFVGVRATPHSLRHTCATDLVRAGAPMPVVQAWLGHETLATTTTYTVPTAGDLRTWSACRQYLPEELRGRSVGQGSLHGPETDTDHVGDRP